MDNNATRDLARCRSTWSANSLFAPLLLGLNLISAPLAADEINVTDAAGRHVLLHQPAHRLLIDDGRVLVALSLISPDPVGLLVAWPRDINRIGKENFELYRSKFPAIDRLAVSASSAGTFSVEKVIAAAPDLAVFSLASQPSDQDRQQIEAAGIPVLIIDFFTHPVTALEPSLRLLGTVTGNEKKTEAFLEFRKQRLNKIVTKIAGLYGKPRPRVFLEPHAGMTNDCCNSPGRGNIGDIIELVGGENIGREPITRAFGKLNAEYIIQRDPEIYVATGGSDLEGTGGLLIGPAYSAERTREILAHLIERPLFLHMHAVQEKRIFALSHQLLNSPLDILTTELLAAWIHPTLFTEQDASETLQHLNTDFLAVPVKGPLWVDAK